MKDDRQRALLTLDAIINLVLGACLLAAPRLTLRILGLPMTDVPFYVTVLGAVLLGIGIALWIERRARGGWRGLGLAGAMVINLLGGGTVLVWLLIDPFDLPVRGYVILWAVAVTVLGTALAELTALVRSQG